MTYNTNFNVKYHDIQKELLNKNNITCHFDNQDILDVCDKLYRDELCSVFYADDILDDKIDQGYKLVYDKMILNQQFKSIICELNNFLSKLDLLDISSNENTDFFILLTLFSKDLFYLTHKCICQQFTLGTIDNELLSQLLQESIKILSDKQI
jgi:hypothetical protein